MVLDGGEISHFTKPGLAGAALADYGPRLIQSLQWSVPWVRK